jgi:hypothetical protein
MDVLCASQGWCRTAAVNEEPDGDDSGDEMN